MQEAVIIYEEKKHLGFFDGSLDYSNKVFKFSQVNKGKMREISLEVQLFPSPEYVTENEDLDLGNEDADGKQILFLCGAGIDCETYKPGDTFRIESKFNCGIVDNKLGQFKLIKRGQEGRGQSKNSEDQIILLPGKYYYHEDGKRIEQI